MPIIDLSAGPIEYEDTGGAGPAIVLLGGLVIGGSLWRRVVGALRVGHRCLVPTLPMGAHRLPMRPDAALTPTSVALLIGEFIERLGLRDATVVENDTGRAQTLVGLRPDVAARLVLVSCEAFEDYPPGLPGRSVALAARVPGGLNALAQPLRLRALRRLPVAYGLLSNRPIPHAFTDDWLRPALTDRAIRRDLERYLRAGRPDDMVRAAAGLRAFDRPAIVVWGADDRLMPPANGRRLAATLPQGRFVAIPDSGTLVPLDQPAALAGAIRAFIRETKEADPQALSAGVASAS